MPAMEHGQILQHLRASGAMSDLTVVCGPQTFKVHKNIVCLRSDWFATHCFGRWMKTKAGETSTIIIKATSSEGDDEDLSCDNPEAFSLMLDFMYLGDYKLKPSASAKIIVALPVSPGPFRPSPPSRPQVSIPRRAPRLADTFQRNEEKAEMKMKKRKKSAQMSSDSDSLPDLERVLEETNHVKGTLTMHVRLYAMASKYQVKGLKEHTISRMEKSMRGVWDREDFSKAIAVAFGSTSEEDKDLREAVIRSILSCSSNLVNDPEVEKAINAVEGLPYQLFKRQSNKGKH